MATDIDQRPAEPTLKAPKQKGAGARKDAWPLLLPALVPIAIFSVIPLIQGIYLGFTDSRAGLNQVTHFTGLENYHDLLSYDLFWQSFRIGLIWAVSVTFLQFASAMGLALLLHQNLRFGWFARVLALVPWAMPPVVTGIMWRLMYDPNYGPVNGFLGTIGLGGDTNLLGNFSTALPAAIVVGVWSGMPQTTIALLAGLQGMDAALHEAAAIDGAGAWQRFRHITLPSLRPTILFVSVTTAIGYLQFFEEPFVMTDGGPLNSTISASMYTYQQFSFGNYGYAAALSYLIFVVIAVVTAVQFRFLAERD